ncbi:50S ribosomal protein L23 [Mycoplasmopsis felifaucium]|uniref:Large ribosomal subunit protein uL23 n=1 Tax=Mycoplasmopsis felifaucium TaxID=35768 RepID=A0ABZ2RQD7_9BACT
MELTRIIRKPIITEKTNEQLSKNVYTFEVDYAANKYQIKKAVEFIFKVKVLDVNTIKVDKKPTRLGRFSGFDNRYKKAIVKLAEGYSIQYYPQQEEAKDAQKAELDKKAKAEEKAKATEKENKVAEKLAAKKAQKLEVAKTEKKEAKKVAPKKEPKKD